MFEKFETMYDGGEPEEDQDLGGEQNLEDEGDTGGEDQECIELFGNKYSLDDDGKNKLLADAKGFETAYHSRTRELAELKEILERDDDSDEDDQNDGGQLPIDTSNMSEEDQEALKVIQGLVSNLTEQQIQKVL